MRTEKVSEDSDRAYGYSKPHLVEVRLRAIVYSGARYGYRKTSNRRVPPSLYRRWVRVYYLCRMRYGNVRCNESVSWYKYGVGKPFQHPLSDVM